MLASRFWSLGVFAVAMAYTEAAVVIYLRRVYGVPDFVREVAPYDPAITVTELSREAATLVMLLAAGWAAGRSLQSRLGLACFTFGLWDIFYYAWLWALIDWPRTLLDWDVLFLIPVPWWGPVLSPVLVAALCVAGGALAAVAEERGLALRPRAADWIALSIGALLVLYTFMADALAALPATPEELNEVRPSAFNWPLYLAGLAAMTWGVLRPTRLPAAAERR